MTVDLTMLDASIKQMQAQGREEKAKQLQQLKINIEKTQAELNSSLRGMKSTGMFKSASCCRRKNRKKEETE